MILTHYFLNIPISKEVDSKLGSSILRVLPDTFVTTATVTELKAVAKTLDVPASTNTSDLLNAINRWNS
jgi:hypothetical protein